MDRRPGHRRLTVAPLLEATSGHEFYNTSPLDLARVLDDPADVSGQSCAYLAGFSESARDIIEHFSFDAQIDRLHRANLLYPVLSSFVEVDLHPHRVSNRETGHLEEELIRKFSDLSDEFAVPGAAA